MHSLTPPTVTFLANMTLSSADSTISFRDTLELERLCAASEGVCGWRREDLRGILGPAELDEEAMEGPEALEEADERLLTLARVCVGGVEED